MEQIGTRFRAIRLTWGLTLRDVEDRSEVLAKEWGNPAFQISASWLDRIERENRRLSAAKLIVLAAIYSISPEQLLALCSGAGDKAPDCRNVSRPNRTLLLTKGPLEEHARSWLPDSIATGPVPDETRLLEPDGHLPSNYQRGIIGRRDKTMDPMIRPGSIVLINNQKKAIAHRREWKNEFDRPIYFLFTRAGYICGWCELDKNAEWLTLAPHPLSYVLAQRWKYRKEVDVIGRVSVVMLHLEEPAQSL
jgi:transcriptional regulator with XRE-family HTH domain